MAEYQGKKVTLNKPFYTPGEKKKKAVYVRNPKGTVIKVRFGDPNMEIKRDDPERRKNFRARHNCDTATDKTTPRHWSCKAWRPISNMKKKSKFSKLATELKKEGADDPRALAAYIGRKKLGAAEFMRRQAAGRKKAAK